jgi:hypothetical protein
MTNLFFCWSEQRSRALARALKEHLPTFIPGLADPDGSNLFMSDDIVKGSRWFDAVEMQLAKADVGVVCITREGLRSGWIHFEAGALARTIRKKRRQGGALLTYLLGVRPDELTGPLAEYQATSVERDDTKKLCDAIVNAMVRRKAQEPSDWETAFNKNWGNFEAAVKAIGPLPAADLIPGLEDLFRRKTFNEPLEDCTRQSWIDRFTAVRETLAALESHRPVMSADNTYLLDLYNQLGAELDGYSMNMGALLLKENRFDIDGQSGKLIVGDGIKRACESRRGKIRQLVTHLLAPNCAPVLEAASRRYAKMSSFDSRKTLLIHPAERAIQGRSPGAPVTVGKKELTDEVLEACAASLWEFDRICFYLVQEHDESADIERLVRDVDQEFESVRAVDGGGSLIPLYYALRALKAKVWARELGVTLKDELIPLLNRIVHIITRYGLDPGGQVSDIIADLQSRLGQDERTPSAKAAIRAVSTPA